MLSDEEYYKRMSIRNNSKIKIGNICEICKTSKRLERHHLSYVPENVITLCKSCHMVMDKKRRLEEKNICDLNVSLL